MFLLKIPKYSPLRDRKLAQVAHVHSGCRPRVLPVGLVRASWQEGDGKL